MVNGYHVFIFFRHDTLGFDRAGNKYWFLCRRIFVEEVDWENGNGNIRYYTSVPQFEELMEALDAKYFEADVTAAIEVNLFSLFKIFLKKGISFYLAILKSFDNIYRWKERK